MKRLFWIGFFIMFAAGCATVEREKALDVSSEVPLSAEEENEVEAARTDAYRTLPAQYAPGEVLPVTVKVSPVPGTSGVIVEETLPVGWEVQESRPRWMQRQNGNVYKWLVWGSSVKSFEIVYSVLVPEDAQGRQEFGGTVKTHREKSAEILGDRVIEPVREP